MLLKCPASSAIIFGQKAKIKLNTTVQQLQYMKGFCWFLIKCLIAMAYVKLANHDRK